MKLWRQCWEAPFKMCLTSHSDFECRLLTTNMMNRAIDALLQLLGLKIFQRNFDTEQCTPALCHRLLPKLWPGSPTAAVFERFSEGRLPNWECLGWECWYGSRKCLGFFSLRCLEESAGAGGVKGVSLSLLGTMIRFGDCLQGLGRALYNSQIQLLTTSHNFVLKNFGQKTVSCSAQGAAACSAVSAICLVMEQNSRGLNSLLPLW